RGSNQKEKQRETFEFLNRFVDSPATMVVIEGSRFDQKAWSLSRSNDQVLSSIAKIFNLRIRLNTNRCKILNNDDAIAEVPQNLSQVVNRDDHYLVQACLTSVGAILVTTDRKLIDAVSPHGIRC